MSGWIKLHRQIVNWEWYSDTKTFRLFLHLLLKANHKDNNHKGKLIKKGCLVTCRELLSVQTGMSVREIRTCLERLKLTNEIAIKTNSKGTEIEIVNYEKYQSTPNEMPNECPSNAHQMPSNNNVKNNKEEKEYILKPKIEFSDEVFKIYEASIKLFSEDLIPTTEKQKNNWLNEFDKLIKIDGLTIKEIYSIIKFARSDEFWNKNFLSISKLRKKDKNDIPYWKVFKHKSELNIIENENHKRISI